MPVGDGDWSMCLVTFHVDNTSTAPTHVHIHLVPHTEHIKHRPHEKYIKFFISKENTKYITIKNKSVSDKRVQQLYSQDQTQEVIDWAEKQVASARQTLENIQRVEEGGLSRNSPNYPGTPRVNDSHRNARNDMQVSYRELHEQVTQLVQAIVPDTKRYWSLEAETASLIVSYGCHEISKSISFRLQQDT